MKSDLASSRPNRHHQVAKLGVIRSGPCIIWESLISEATFACTSWPAGVLTAPIFSAPSFAADRSTGKEGSGEACRASARPASSSVRRPNRCLRIEADRSASRDVLLDDCRDRQAYTIVGRSSRWPRGEVRRPMPPVIDAIKNAKAGGKRDLHRRRG